MTSFGDMVPGRDVILSTLASPRLVDGNSAQVPKQDWRTDWGSPAAHGYLLKLYSS